MWTNLVVVAALTLMTGQDSELTLANARTTYGILGPARPDNKVLPGDTVVLSFGIKGMRANEAGKVRYRFGMDVTGVPEKALALPFRFELELNRPGKFTLELKATDTVANKEATVSFPVTVAK